MGRRGSSLHAGAEPLADPRSAAPDRPHHPRISLRRRRRALGRPIANVIGILLLLLFALPWFVYVLKYVPNTVREWQEDATGINATLGPKHSPWFHYLLNLPLTAAPWSILLIVGLLM